MKLNLSEAFRKLRAKPENIRYSVSAFSRDGNLVLSLWEHYFVKAEIGVVYVDRLSRWSGRGNALHREHLQHAIVADSSVHAIVAHTRDHHAIDSGEDGSKVKKEFHIMEQFVGKIVEFDGDRFVIHFQKPSQ